MDMTGAAAALNRVPPCMMIKSQSSLGAGNRIAIESRTCLKTQIELESGFRDVSHVLYYQTRMMRREKATTAMMASCGGLETDKKMKKDEKKKMKKLKLLKELTKDLSMLSQVGLVGEDNVGGISEAAETLIKHLQEMKSKEKELKKKRKMEKAMMKAAANSSSSSESSDSECGEIVDLASLRTSEAPKGHSKIDSCLTVPSIDANLTQANPFEGLNLCKPVTVAETSTKKIEVCMGGKCKKSGAAQLVVEFEKVVGEGVAVVGCKCMGKCRDGPNVRVLSSSNGADVIDLGKIDASLSPPPLCIGVGLEDVGVIVANFLGRGSISSSSSSSQASLAVAAT